MYQSFFNTQKKGVISLMTELFKLIGTVALKGTDKAGDELDDVTKKANDSSNKMVEAFKKIGTAVATYFAIDKIRDFGEACINAAADTEAMNSQFTQVFGDLEEQATGSLESIADSAGISTNRMKGSFTKIAAFAKTTGMSTEASLELSERAMIAVADSAAFYDRSLEDTTESLQSFLKGNYENDAALGLSCTEVTRNAAANELYGMSFNDLSEAQKQLTLLQMVEDANAASGALGQAARESDTWTNQTGNLKQAWHDFEAIIGATFLPSLIELVKNLASGIEGAGVKVQAFIGWCKENETIVKLLAIAVGTITTAIVAYNVAVNATTIATNAATLASQAFGAVMAFIHSPITAIIAVIGLLVAAGVALYENWDEVKAVASHLWNGIKNTFDKIKNTVSNTMTTVQNKVKSVIDKIKSFFKFNVELPKIKLPHFSITPKGWEIGDLLVGKIPKLGIEWYAKGGVMKEPTIFGMNGSNAMVGGEAGDEAIAPIDVLQKYVADAVASQNAGLAEAISNGFDTLLAFLQEYLPEMANMQLVTDTGALVGELAPAMDDALGIIAARKERL